MRRGLWSVVAGLCVGYSMAAFTVGAQPADRVLMKGHGRAITGLRHTQVEPFRLLMSDTPERGFVVVPPGRTFVLTDVMFIAQESVRDQVAVNISVIGPHQPGPRILFQTRIGPRASEDVHLCSGYVIPEGHSLVAYTGASFAPEQ